MGAYFFSPRETKMILIVPSVTSKIRARKITTGKITQAYQSKGASTNCTSSKSIN
jgi:hypothetical protein